MKQTNLPSIITLQKWYAEFNVMIFNNELPFVTIDYSRSKTRMGSVTYYWRPSYKRFKKLSISNVYKFTENEYKHILLHEMIHIWQFVNNIKPNHSYSFIKMMNRVNNITNNHYNVTTKYFGKLIINETNHKECILVTFRVDGGIGLVKANDKNLDAALHRLSKIYKDIELYRCKGCNCESLSYYRRNTRTYKFYSIEQFNNKFTNEIIKKMEVLYAR